MKKAFIAAVIIIPVLVFAGMFGYTLYHGPRMKEQLHIRAFQAPAPLPPPGTATVDTHPSLPATGGAAERNPLAGTKEDLTRGEVYYHYYCVFCHGESGGGNGPVGESYIPAPADLRVAKIGAYGDAQLMRAMLTGIGHEPVLEQVIPERHRWYLVLYVRSLEEKSGG